MLKKIFYVASLALILSSCAKDVLSSDKEEITDSSFKPNFITRGLVQEEKEALMLEFARVLSIAIYERQDVRDFVKSEAVKQFDRNYDILYVGVKDKRIGNSTFREILKDFSSEEFICELEQAVPLLNILFPKLPMFDLTPEKYDTRDNELPVIVPLDKKNALFFRGECTDLLEKGQIPGFNTLVINENRCVIVDEKTLSTPSHFEFRDPVYDGSLYNNEMSTRGAWVPASIVGNKAVAAAQLFNSDDSSIYSMALQRDNIYFGMTPFVHTGSLNLNVTEYLSFLEIDPSAYFYFADERNPDSPSDSDDPYIKNNTVSKTHSDFTEEELIDALWTVGRYAFRFEVPVSSTNGTICHIILLRPEDLWNFNLTRTYQHETWFRPKKYTYTIDVDDFTPKRVDLFQYFYSLGKWNLKEESLYRQISIWEEDKGSSSTISYTYEATFMRSENFSGNVKLNIGLGNDSNGGIQITTTTTNTTKSSRTASVTRPQSSDYLGSTLMYYYDPVLEYGSSTSCVIHTYTVGPVKIGVTAF